MESAEEPSSTDCLEDLQLLLDCLRYNHGNTHHGSPQRQALTTIATMCSNDSGVRDQLRNCGGLSFLLELAVKKPATPTLQATLLALGCSCEKNLVNQSRLCQLALFSLLTSLLESHDSHMTLLQSAAYLLSCLVTGNSRGQNMARECGVLLPLISLFKKLLPSGDTGDTGEGVTCAGGEGVDVWKSVASALCTATNNPQNEENQKAASAVFPAAMALVSHQLQLGQTALSLVTSCVASNAGVQSRLAMVGGLHSLVQALTRTVERRELEMVQLLQCISAAASGHTSNSRTLSSLGCVALLLSLLEIPSLSISCQTSLCLCLGNLTEDNVSAQSEVVEKGGVPLLISLLSDQQDEELGRAAVFVLECCIHDNRFDAVSTGQLPLTHHATGDSMPLSQSALRELGDQNPPSLKVTSWLHSANCGNSDWLPRLQMLQKLLQEVDLSPLTAHWNGNEAQPAPRNEFETEPDGTTEAIGTKNGMETVPKNGNGVPTAEAESPAHCERNSPYPSSHTPSCLACAPRLRCPLITSRSFLSVMTSDPYTCPYHHRLASRFSSQVREGHTQPETASQVREGHTQPEMAPSQVNEGHTQPTTEDPLSSTDSDITYVPSSSTGSTDSMELLTPPLSIAGDSDNPTLSIAGDSNNPTLSIAGDSNNPTLSIAGDSDNPTLSIAGKTHRVQSLLGAVLSHQISPRCHDNCKPLSQTRRYVLSNGPVSNKKIKVIDRVRQPLRDRSNIPSGVGSEYNYSTPATEKKKMAAERASGKVVVPSSKVGVVPFSRQEVVQLMEGVRKFGRKWSHILSVYDFHHSRTGTSLKDKFRNLTQRR